MLVTSFSSRDMDPERSLAAGVQLLRQYLQFVESNGENLGDVVIDKPMLNPFEVDVRDTLTRHGLKLIAQYGSSGYWIDYAVAHPTQPGRFVLAIECDGATYHSSESARDRDRLRQEQLERLGWRFHRIWSSDWFYNKDKAVASVLKAYELALRSDDEPPRQEVRSESPAQETQLFDVSKRPGKRPQLGRWSAIDDYTTAEITRLVCWIESDDLIRTHEELLDETIRELGFSRRGRKIVTAVEAAIKQARRPAQRVAHD